MSEIKGSSSELQKLSLVGLVHDSYLLSKCADAITEGYYSNVEYKIIYHCLRKFYKTYDKVPDETTLNTEIERYVQGNDGGSVQFDAIKHTVKNLYAAQISSVDSLYCNVTDFIRRSRIEDSMGHIVNYMNTTGSVNLETIADELQKSINLRFNKLPVTNLLDVASSPDKIVEIRSDILGMENSPVSAGIFVEAMNDAFQYKKLIPGTLNMITASPGSGKTTWLINEGVYVASQDLNVLHVFLGDMSTYDGLIRYISCCTGIESSKLVTFSAENISKYVESVNMTKFNGKSAKSILSHIDIASYAADQLTTTQLVEEISLMQRERNIHYNVVIIDYDENIVVEADSMYASGGQIYNKIALFAVLNKTIVFIASQPKPEYWKYEILPMESASESSKKQKIIDLMVTMGKPSRDSTVATLHIAKNRRGVTGKLYRLKINGANAQMTHITEDEYTRIKTSESQGSSGNSSTSAGTAVEPKIPDSMLADINSRDTSNIKV